MYTNITIFALIKRQTNTIEMKTKTISGMLEILLVDIEDNIQGVNYSIHNKESTRTAIIVQMKGWTSYPLILPENLPLEDNYQYINTIENLTEDEAKGLVGRVAQHYIMYGYTNIYGCWTDTALKSFNSLLQDSESTDFNPATTLIFIKEPNV